MDEFLAVAKSLEIKELCNAKTEPNDEPVDCPSPNDQDSPTEVMQEEQTVRADNIREQPSQERQASVVTGKYECDQCNKTYSTKKGLSYHKQSVHQGVKYACGQCDYQGTTQSILTVHIQSKHEGIKYACDQCDYQATDPTHPHVE